MLSFRLFYSLISAFSHDSGQSWTLTTTVIPLVNSWGAGSSQWAVRICVSISPSRLWTWSSALHCNHLSVFAPRRTADIFPFFLPLSPKNHFLIHPSPLAVSLSCPFPRSSIIGAAHFDSCKPKPTSSHCQNQAKTATVAFCLFGPSLTLCLTCAFVRMLVCMPAGPVVSVQRAFKSFSKCFARVILDGNRQWHVSFKTA